MITLHYTFEGQPFEYTIDREQAHKALYNWFIDNWSHDDFIEYILMRDTDTIDLLEDFKDELHEAFEDEAEEDFYYGEEYDD